LNAVVVYESLWGNTAAVAREIAEGLGPGARALSTAEATGEAMRGVDLVVAWHDTAHLGELIDTAVAFKRTLVAALDPAAAARLGG